MTLVADLPLSTPYMLVLSQNLSLIHFSSYIIIFFPWVITFTLTASVDDFQVSSH